MVNQKTMLEAKNNLYTKEEELNLGRLVQKGIKAEKELEKDNLSQDKILELAKQVNEGKVAQEKLFNAEIGLANNLSRNLYKKAGTRYSLDDIIQDAYLALTEATNTYDPEKNCRLSTHAYYKISKMISTRLNKMRSVRLPENRMGQYLEIHRAENKYLSMVKNPDNSEMKAFVLKETNIPEDVYLLIKSSLQPITSTSAPIGENGQFEDLLKDPNGTSQLDIHNPVLAEMLSSLPKDDQIAISLSYNVGLAGESYSEYLREHNLTPDEMEAKVKKILRKLRKESKKFIKEIK